VNPAWKWAVGGILSLVLLFVSAFVSDRERRLMRAEDNINALEQGLYRIEERTILMSKQMDRLLDEVARLHNLPMRKASP